MYIRCPLNIKHNLLNIVNGRLTKREKLPKKSNKKVCMNN